MVLNNPFIVILLVLFCHFVRSAPSLNNNSKMSNDIVISVNDDFTSDNGLSRTSNHSNSLGEKIYRF